MPNRSPQSRRITAVALLGGGVAAGVIGATALGASAQSTSTTSSSTTTSSVTAPSNHGRGGGNGETPVTGSKATQLKAAALKQVPGATVDRVTTDTDYSGAAYEVHVTKSDGTEVEVLFDTNLKYVTSQTDTGHHGHGGGGGGNGETAVTGANATTLRAAALKQVPGATVEEVTTDSGDAAFEVHLKKADGTEVTAKFDKNLTFVSTEDGRGK